jgi:hypothetical protein
MLHWVATHSEVDSKRRRWRKASREKRRKGGNGMPGLELSSCFARRRFGPNIQGSIAKAKESYKHPKPIKPKDDTLAQLLSSSIIEPSATSSSQTYNPSLETRLCSSRHTARISFASSNSSARISSSTHSSRPPSPPYSLRSVHDRRERRDEGNRNGRRADSKEKERTRPGS